MESVGSYQNMWAVVDIGVVLEELGGVTVSAVVVAVVTVVVEDRGSAADAAATAVEEAPAWERLGGSRMEEGMAEAAAGGRAGGPQLGGFGETGTSSTTTPAVVLRILFSRCVRNIRLLSG